MDISEVAFAFGGEVFSFSIREKDITKFEEQDGDVIVHYGDRRNITIKEHAIYTITRGTPIASKETLSITKNKKSLQEFHVRKKKKRK